VELENMGEKIQDFFRVMEIFKIDFGDDYQLHEYAEISELYTLNM
jgi:hypothetical protein